MLHHERQVKINEDRVLQLAREGIAVGFCLACGNEQSPVPPQAANVRCHHCHMRQVYGAQQIVEQGLNVP